MSERVLGRPALAADTLRQWLNGQRMAETVIAEERRRWLTGLNREEALHLYLQLVSLPDANRREPTPSPVLEAMRRATARNKP